MIFREIFPNGPGHQVLDSLAATQDLMNHSAVRLGAARK